MVTPPVSTAQASTTAQIASPPVQGHASGAGAQLDGVSNRPRAAEAGGRVVHWIRSGAHHVFEGVRNLFHGGVRHAPAAQQTEAQATAHRQALMLETSSQALLNSIPAQQSMLESTSLPFSSKDCEAFAAAFRTMGTGVKAFHMLAQANVAQGTMSPNDAAEITKLVDPNAPVVNGESTTQLWTHLSAGDTGFLANTQGRTEFLAYLERVTDAVAGFASVLGEQALAGKFNVVCRLRADSIVGAPIEPLPEPGDRGRHHHGGEGDQRQHIRS